MVHVRGTSATGHRSSGPRDNSPKANSRPILPPPILCAATRYDRSKGGGGKAGLRGGEQEAATVRSGLQAAPSPSRRPPAPRRPPAEPCSPYRGAAGSSPSGEVSWSEEEETPTGNAGPAAQPREWRLHARPAGKYRAPAPEVPSRASGSPPPPAPKVPSWAGLGWGKQGPTPGLGFPLFAFPFFVCLDCCLFFFLLICSFLIRTHSLAYCLY